MQMIFELFQDGFIPRLPQDRHSRQPRLPDGKRYFSLAQAADRSGTPEPLLRTRYFATLSDLLDPAELASLLGEPPPVGAEDSVPASPPHVATESSAPGTPDRGDPIDAAVTKARLSLLRAARYPRLADEHWEEFMEICQRRRLDPWLNQIYATLREDERTGEDRLQIIMGIEGTRLTAHRTGEYGGCDAPVFTTNAAERLVAKCTVYRLTFPPALAGARRHHRCRFLYA